MPGILDDMDFYTEQRIDKYVVLAHIPRAKLKAVTRLSLEERNLSDQGNGQPGELTILAAKVHMNILCAARMFRFGSL